MNFSKSLITIALLGAMATSSGVNAQESKTQVKIAQKSKVTNVVGIIAEEKDVPSLTSRESSYRSVQSGVDLVKEFKAKAVTINGKAVETKARSAERNEKSGTHIEIYDAAVLLKTDEDGDGYYSEIRVDFDADADYSGYFDLYAELYIREEGASTWTHYFTTDVFEIYGSSDDDIYHVTTTFNDGFPSGNYEIAIDLFEHGYSGTVDSYEANDDSDLGNLPIEDTSFENYQPNTGVSVSTVKTEIFTDSDGDGFYRDFKISFDADVDSGSRDVVAKLYQKTGTGGWQFETESSVYTITGTNTDDAISFEAEWASGYATSYYDFKIEIVDSATNEFLAEASTEFGPLVDVPLEDAGKDNNAGGSGSGSGSGTGGSPSTTSSESGGGSWNILGLLMLSLMGLVRRKR